MEEYLLQLSNILDDGFQWRDLLPIAIITAVTMWKIGVVKIPQKSRK
jgi:hypothetical protein